MNTDIFKKKKAKIYILRSVIVCYLLHSPDGPDLYPTEKRFGII